MRLYVVIRFNMPLLRSIRLTLENPQALSDLVTVALEYVTDEKFFEMKKAAKILAHHCKNRTALADEIKSRKKR